jgi:hypothetical protein|tara:strand:- start:16 stop:153 length:138 start_codon:yes stop_codon:yes gene_type:complete
VNQEELKRGESIAKRGKFISFLKGERDGFNAGEGDLREVRFIDNL